MPDQSASNRREEEAAALAELFAPFTRRGWEPQDRYDFGTYWTCPCGDLIEPDGNCPQGHRAPLIQMGMI